MRTLCWMCRLCFFFLSLPVLSLNHFSFMGFFLATGFRAVLALSFSSYSFSLFSQLPAKQGCIGVRCSASSWHRDCIVRKHLLSETRELSILSCRLCDGSVTMNVLTYRGLRSGISLESSLGAFPYFSRLAFSSKLKREHCQ